LYNFGVGLDCSVGFGILIIYVMVGWCWCVGCLLGFEV